MQISPYLTFGGTCAEAFKLYEQAFSGKTIVMQTFGESPMAAQVPPDWQGKVVHARLAVGDMILMGSDATPERYQKPQGISVSIQVDEPADADRIFAALSDGGMAEMPIQETFWASRFGMCVDRFGIAWMVNCEKKPA